jgi:hypothetical protein
MLARLFEPPAAISRLATTDQRKLLSLKQALGHQA